LRSGAAHVTVFADPVAIGPAPALHGEYSKELESRAREIARLIDSAGVATVSCGDVMPIIWTKLLYNVALNPLGALFELSYGELAADPDLRAIMDDLIGEAFAVSLKLGIALPFADSREYRDTFYGKLIPATATHRPTMLYDLKNRGRTDIDSLNGKIVELAGHTGLTAPVNQMLVRQVHAAERAARRRGTESRCAVCVSGGGVLTRSSHGRSAIFPTNVAGSSSAMTRPRRCVRSRTPRTASPRKTRRRFRAMREPRS